MSGEVLAGLVVTCLSWMGVFLEGAFVFSFHREYTEYTKLHTSFLLAKTDEDKKRLEAAYKAKRNRAIVAGAGMVIFIPILLAFLLWSVAG